MRIKKLLHKYFTNEEIEFLALADLVEDIGYLADHNMLDEPQYSRLMAKYNKMIRTVAKNISSKRVKDFRNSVQKSNIDYEQTMKDRHLSDKEKRACSALLIEWYK